MRLDSPADPDAAPGARLWGRARWEMMRRAGASSPFVFVSDRKAPFSTVGFARILDRAARQFSVWQGERVSQLSTCIDNCSPDLLGIDRTPPVAQASGRLVGPHSITESEIRAVNAGPSTLPYQVGQGPAAALC